MLRSGQQVACTSHGSAAGVSSPAPGKGFYGKTGLCSLFSPLARLWVLFPTAQMRVLPLEKTAPSAASSRGRDHAYLWVPSWIPRHPTTTSCRLDLLETSRSFTAPLCLVSTLRPLSLYHSFAVATERTFETQREQLLPLGMKSDLLMVAHRTLGGLALPDLTGT